MAAVLKAVALTAVRRTRPQPRTSDPNCDERVRRDARVERQPVRGALFVRTPTVWNHPGSGDGLRSIVMPKRRITATD